MRDQAYAEAAARREARLADPYQDEQYANQEAEAYAAYYSALDQAGAAWAAAEQAAYDEWQAAICAAESTYTQTESQAWNQYLERLDELNSQLVDTYLTLEGAFQTAWNNAVRDWTEMESAAWDAYQRARTQMLQQPPEGERQVGPPPLNVANLLAMQVGGGGQRRLEIPDKELSRAVISDFEKEVIRRTPNNLHGWVVLKIAQRTQRTNPGAGVVGELDILNNDQQLGRKWQDTTQKIRDTLTKAGYVNIQVRLSARVEYECTNHAGTPRSTALANLASKVTYIIEVQATKGGMNYAKVFEINWKGIVVEAGTNGGSYPEPKKPKP
jgi:hypothetical protein